MVTQNTNPFVLPGFGQSGDMATNPMLASMEMMRKAWENLAQASGFDGSMLAAGTSPDELERRISDLRAVENWLRMNLSVLSGTIQTLETQRATLATLQAFVASAGGAHAADSQSPLDVALGIPRGQSAAPSGDTSGLFGDQAGKQAAGTAAADRGQATDTASSSTASAAARDASGTGQAGESATGAADAAIKSWWDMLQAQFDNLASATAATLQGAGAMQDAATEAQKQAVDAARVAAQSMQESAANVMTPTGTAAKKATGKSATKKTAAKKAAAKKTAAKKTAARKTAAKKSASGKAASKTAAKTGAKRASKAAAKKSAGTGAQ